MKVRKVRVVIYARGDDVEQQLEACRVLCEQRGYKVVGIACDRPGELSAWHDAQRMLRRDEADRVVFASGQLVPDVLESVTGEIPGPAAIQRAPGSRRIRPVPRPGGAA